MSALCRNYFCGYIYSGVSIWKLLCVCVIAKSYIFLCLLLKGMPVDCHSQVAKPRLETLFLVLNPRKFPEYSLQLSALTWQLDLLSCELRNVMSLLLMAYLLRNKLDKRSALLCCTCEEKARLSVIYTSSCCSFPFGSLNKFVAMIHKRAFLL